MDPELELKQIKSDLVNLLAVVYPAFEILGYKPFPIDGLLRIREALHNAINLINEMLLPKWPEPTTDEPDMETLEGWMIEDSGCEATDGCWVEPDGTCPHGHPSWFLRLGLI